MSAPRTAKRSLSRRFGESAFGALLLVRIGALGLLVLLLLAGGAWASWDNTLRHVIDPDGRVRGTMTVLECDRHVCTGPLDGTGATVALEQTIAREPGETLAVVLRPGTDEAVRAGLPGVLYACLPLMGSLLLSGILIGGVLRWYRTAWATAGVALAALAVTFTVWM